jgi:hypothetical protein
MWKCREAARRWGAGGGGQVETDRVRVVVSCELRNRNTVQHLLPSEKLQAGGWGVKHEREEGVTMGEGDEGRKDRRAKQETAREKVRVLGRDQGESQPSDRMRTK